MINKFLNFFFLQIFSLVLFGQKQAPSLGISIVCANTIIDSPGDIKFIGEIRNYSLISKIIPRYFSVDNEAGFGKIGYEVICLYYDSASKLNWDLKPLTDPEPDTEVIELKPDKAHLFELNLRPQIFPQKGVYKIRFILHKNSIESGSAELESKWVIINVRNNLLPQERRKS